MAEVKVSALTALTGANVANGDELYIVDTGSPNVSKKITADELAQMPQLSSRYAARADEFVWLGAGDFELGYASPSRSRLTNSGYPGWLLDASSIEGIIASARLPTHYSTFHVDLYWTNAGAGAGDAYIRFGVSMTGDGESLNNYSGKGFTSFGAVTAPAQWVLEVTRLTASAGTNQSGEIFGIYIDRLADDAADTLGNDIAIVGVLITKAS